MSSRPSVRPAPVTMLRVAIVDDHAVVREGVARIVSASPDMEVSIVAASGSALLAELRVVPVDVCVVDLSLPDVSGVELITRIRDLHPSVKVLVFTMHPEEAFGMACLKAGASGFLTKGAAPSEVLSALRSVGRGLVHVTPELAALLVRPERAEDLPHTTLSAREHEVFVRIAQGLRNQEISQLLHLDQRTVSTYRRRVLDKLGVASGAELVQYAMRHGLIREGVGPSSAKWPEPMAAVSRGFLDIWERLMGSSEVALVAVDTVGVITHWSQHATRLYGWSRQEAIGSKLGTMIVAVEGIEAALAAIDDLRRGLHWEGRMQVRTRSGELLAVDVVNCAVFGEDATVVGLCGLSVLAGTAEASTSELTRLHRVR